MNGAKGKGHAEKVSRALNLSPLSFRQSGGVCVINYPIVILGE